MIAVTRAGFKHAVFLGTSQETFIDQGKAESIHRDDLGLVIKSKAGVMVLVPWGNVTYAHDAPEEPKAKK